MASFYTVRRCSFSRLTPKIMMGLVVGILVWHFCLRKKAEVGEEIAKTDMMEVFKN